jgi:protein-glutamine gamma-glutamyltransferase
MRLVRHTAEPAVGEGPMNWLVLALIVLLAPHSLTQPTWVVGLALLAVAWRFLAVRHRIPLPGRWLLAVLAFMATAGVIATHGTVLGRDAGVSLLLIMTGLKMLETRNQRDAMLTVFLGYFVVVTHFLYSQEIPMVAYLAAAMLLTTMVLIRLNAAGPPPGLREQAGLAGLMLVQALPVMLILFLLFPRLPGPLWGIAQDEPVARTGLSDSMSPGSISDLLQSDAPALRARFPDGPPPAAFRYWRGPVFSDYDGRTWRAGQTSTPATDPDPSDAVGEIQYSVRLEPHRHRWLLALDPPASAPQGMRLNADYVLFNPRPVQRVENYDLTAVPRATLEAELSAERRQQALRIPDTAGPRARELAARWADEGAAPEDVVEKAMRYFNEQPFHYTLSPPRLPADPVDGFLFDTRAGFCEHYAGSFVFLMRAAGIPARVVTGYQGGEWNRAGGYLLVRQSDAHAWAEVWLEDRGWLRVDPTGAVAPERIELGIRAALSHEEDLPAFLRRSDSLSGLAAIRIQWEYWRETTAYYWNGWVLGFGPERQRELLGRLGLGGLDWRGTVALMAALLALVAAVFALAFLWHNRRPERDPLARLYRRFAKRMARLGIPPLPHEGPRDFANRVARERPELHEVVAPFTRTYEALRYGPDPDPDLFRILRTRLRGLH